MQMHDKKDREDVIAKENDQAKILRLEEELKALRKQKATWEEKSVRKLTEDPPESEQETVTVSVLSSDVKVKNPKFKKTAENDHKRKWRAGGRAVQCRRLCGPSGVHSEQGDQGAVQG